jgi:hypothetical protein
MSSRVKNVSGFKPPPAPSSSFSSSSSAIGFSALTIWASSSSSSSVSSGKHECPSSCRCAHRIPFFGVWLLFVCLAFSVFYLYEIFHEL